MKSPKNERCTAFQARLALDKMTLDFGLAGNEPRVVDFQGRRTKFLGLCTQSTPVCPTDDNVGASVRRTRLDTGIHHASNILCAPRLQSNETQTVTWVKATGF